MVQAEHRRGGEGEQGGKKTLLWPQSAGIQGKDPLLSGAIFCPSPARAASLFPLQFQMSSHTHPALKCRQIPDLHRPKFAAPAHNTCGRERLAIDFGNGKPAKLPNTLPPLRTPNYFQEQDGRRAASRFPPPRVPWWEQGAWFAAGCVYSAHQPKPAIAPSRNGAAA